MGRLFAVMGMQPVGYYDLTPADVPVHSTAFRAVNEASLRISPFRMLIRRLSAHERGWHLLVQSSRQRSSTLCRDSEPRCFSSSIGRGRFG